MGAFSAADIRNVALVGHAGAGKTSLGEAILFKAGVTKRLGSVDDGSSHLDYDDESRERKHSVDSTVFYVDHQGTRINLIDTPGMPDYCGLALAALAAVETAIVVVPATAGIGVNTRRMFQAAGDLGLARMIVVNRIDAENVDLNQILTDIRASFGEHCLPIDLPADHHRKVIDLLSAEDGQADVLNVKEYHTKLLDAIVEIDDSLMEEYMSTGAVPAEKLPTAIHAAVASGHVIPILFTDAKHDIGISDLLEDIVKCCPSPVDGKKRKLRRGEGAGAVETEIEPKPDGPFIAQAFKITSDPKSGIKYSVARIHSGSIKADGQLFMHGDRKGNRPGHILKLRGDEHEELAAGTVGDLVAFAKLDIRIGDVLTDKPDDCSIELPKFPTPMFGQALEPKTRQDIEKVSGALQRFAEEDPCFSYHRDPDTGELVMHGLGDQHLTVVRSRMKRLFKLEIDVHPPKIPYRETIAGSAKYVEHTHKKQTGGAGQFAKVAIDLEPNERGKGYEFVDKIFGGAIDLQFRPSVDKGIRTVLQRGVIAGSPVVDVKVSLVDGKTHPVDSKDIAFQVAGRMAFKKAFMAARPILLEPIVKMEVTVPADYVGEITRDLAGKRGQIEGQDMMPGNLAVIRALVPLAEVQSYSSQLKSVTHGQGSYMMELSHYDVAPPMVQQQVVAAYGKKGAEEEEE